MTKNTKLGTRYAQAVQKPQPAGSKIGWNPAQVPNPTIATPSSPPQTDQGKAETRAAIDTYFTKVGSTDILYSGDRQWARVTLILETAGPVAVGTAQKLQPVTSGVGQLLTTNIPVTFTIAKGTRLYIAATGLNRVKRMIEPVPWLEQITAGVLGLLSRRG